MKKKILIVEDNPIQLEGLKCLVAEVAPDAVIYTATDETGAYKILMEKTIDVFMTDIILNKDKSGDIAGIRLVEKIRTISQYMFTPVIFITSLEDSSGYAYKDLNCLGYIEKPFSPDEVKKMVKKAMNYSTIKEKDTTICFRKDGILFPIMVDDMVYIESHNRSINIYLQNGDVFEVPYFTCKQILEENDTDSLMQCSRNTIVNKKYIYNIDFINRYITLKNNMGKVEIGITYKKKISAEYEK